MSELLLKQINEERQVAWTAAQATNDEAQEAGGFTEETEAKWQRHMDEVNALDKRAEQVVEVVEGEKRLKAALDGAGDIEGRTTDDEPENRANQIGEARAKFRNDIRAVASGEKRYFEFDLPTDEEVRASETPGGLEARAEQEVKTDAKGGFLANKQFSTDLHKYLIEYSSIRQTNAKRMVTSHGNQFEQKKLLSRPTASFIAETGTFPKSGATVGTTTVSAFKIGFLGEMTRELLEDDDYNLAGELAKLGGEAIGEGMNEKFINGTGTGQPEGLATVATTGKTAAATDDITGDELIDLEMSVIAPYRARAEYLFSESALSAVRKLKDAEGRPLWQQGMAGGYPPTINGYTYRTDHNMPVMATGNKAVLFGDFSAYLIRDVRSIRIERSDEFGFDEDLVYWKFAFRADGRVIDSTGAYKALVMA